MTALIAWLESLAQQTSLEIFTVIASFLEEIVAPIPSPFVMTTAAVIGQAQNYTYLQLFWVIILGSIAKTIAAVGVYYIVDKAEDVVVGKFGKYIGISHKEVEKIGSILTKTWYDDVLLFVARALPIVPSTLVSVAAGAIKYNLRSYIFMTFLGNIFRSAFYLWVGYVGAETAAKIWGELQGQPIFIVLAVVLTLGLLYILLKLKDHIWETMFDKAANKNSKSSDKTAT